MGGAEEEGWFGVGGDGASGAGGECFTRAWLRHRVNCGCRDGMTVLEDRIYRSELVREAQSYTQALV